MASNGGSLEMEFKNDDAFSKLELEFGVKFPAAIAEVVLGGNESVSHRE